MKNKFEIFGGFIVENYKGGLSISQNTNIDSLANILTKTKELVEDKFMKAQKSYQGIVKLK